MDRPHPFALFRTTDQWMRASHLDTTVNREAGCVELSWTADTEEIAQTPPALSGAGLAFDPWCRLYHSLPEVGTVERSLWAAGNAAITEKPVGLDLFAPGPAFAGGDFFSRDPAPGLRAPCGIGFDDAGRMILAETGADRVLVYDLDARRLERTLVFPGGAPTDIATHGDEIWIVLSAGGWIAHVRGRSDPEILPLPKECADVSRLAVSGAGRLAILESGGKATARARVVAGGAVSWVEDIPFAADLEWLDDDTLVIARAEADDFLVRRWTGGIPESRPPLHGRDYDGRGIVATPPRGAAGERRILFATCSGTFRHAVAARLRYERSGRVTTYRLDGGEFQTVWGRLFLEACIPLGSSLRVRCDSRDDPDESVAADPARLGPGGIDRTKLGHWDKTPPLPPPEVFADPEEGWSFLHRREAGRELAWSLPPSSDRFVVYEMPIDVPAGRYLWVQVELAGNTRVSPRVRALRAEHPSHDYLRRLPRVYSRDTESAGFLRRYLSIFESLLGDLESRSVHRQVLLDPGGAPAEALPWLAGFMGLMLDERWSRAPRPGGGTTDARRAIVKDAEWLFRFRGTLPGLRRFIQHYAGVSPILIEHFRIRGLGGGMVSEDTVAFTNAVLGAGFRVGGVAGDPASRPLEGKAPDDGGENAFESHAHRFTVVIPAALDEEQLDVVRHILEVHRPAHTVFTACTVAAGMRIGRGLQAAISSVVGRSGDFAPLQLGESALGRGGLLGRPQPGLPTGHARLGQGARIRS